MPGERAYLMDMRLLFCLNDPSPCDINVTIFENTKLLKRQCTWSTGFQHTGKNWIFFGLFKFDMYSNVKTPRHDATQLQAGCVGFVRIAN